mgnify:FL=1
MNKWLDKNIIKIITLFLILGPFFDLTTSLLINVFKISFNFIIIVKLLFLFIILYYSIFISKNKYKKYSLLYYLFIFMYLLISIIYAYLNKDFIYEVSNIFRYFFFPMALVSLYIIYLDNKKIDSKILSIVFLEYLLLIFIPLVTKTGFNSYAYSKVGSIGWFNSTNEIGGIFTILLPFFLKELINKKNIILNIIFFIIIIFVSFSMGSKVPVITTLLTYLLFIILYLKNNKEKIKLLVLPFILLISLSIYLIPKTNFYQNIKIHLDFLEIKNVEDLLTIKNIDHFIFSSRLKFLNETRTNFNNSDLYNHIMGIGYIENYGTDDVNIKTIEMDYFDILYRNGYVGFILYFIPVIYILYKIKMNKKLEIYSLVLSLILALFQGHILVSPSVSICVIIIMLNGGNYEKLFYNSEL